MKFNKRHFFLRLLVSPFVFGLLVITFSYLGIKRWFLFLMHGGEFISYEKDENSKSIYEVYKFIKEQNIK